VLAELVEDARAEKSAVSSEVLALRTQLGKVQEKNSAIVFEINRIKRNIKELKDIEDFDDSDLEGKKKKFNDLYNTKSSHGNK